VKPGFSLIGAGLGVRLAIAGAATLLIWLSVALTLY
jgi:hypothetical protein